MEIFPQLTSLFALARPYLEKNDLGAAHTERVLKITQKHFQIPSGLEELVYATIILHDIGGSYIKDQYEKGPVIATKLLKTLKYNEKFIKEVCDITIKHHDRYVSPSVRFKILYDSDQLVKFTKEEFISYDSSRDFDWNKIIEKLYFDHSKKLAMKMWKDAIKVIN